MSINIMIIVRILKEGALNRWLKLPFEAIRLAHENFSANCRLLLWEFPGREASKTTS